MLTPDQFLAFLMAAMVITAAPGPDNLLVLGLGMSRGPRHGMVFGLGCAIGCLSHTLLAVLGVSALFAASPLAFTALKVAGGAYLCWLGWQALRSSGSIGAVPVQPAPDSMARLFAKGLLANAINPKVMLFFLSFLPQFVDASRGHVSAQTAWLGVVFTLQAAVLFGLLGAFAGRIGRVLQRSPRLGLWMDRVTGAVFIGLGLRLALAR